MVDGLGINEFGEVLKFNQMKFGSSMTDGSGIDEFGEVFKFDQMTFEIVDD